MADAHHNRAVAEILANLNFIVEQGKDDSALYFVLALSRKIRQGGWRGDASFFVDEFKVKQIEFTERFNLNLTKENFESGMDNVSIDRQET